MDIESYIGKLYGKDNAVAYDSLKELEKLSDDTGVLYDYTLDFLKMIKSGRYAVRVRGIRLLLKQAKWDKDKIIDRHFEEALNMLHDEKPTAVRQTIAAFYNMIEYKPNLMERLKRELTEIDYMAYKDSMQGLIKKDIKNLTVFIDRNTSVN